jgi:hypothetical protein
MTGRATLRNQPGGMVELERSVMNATGHHHVARVCYLAAALAACAGLLTASAAAPAAAESARYSVPRTGAVHSIHLVAHETQRKFFNHGGFGDEEIFRGILDNASGSTRVGIFAGTLTSVSSNDSLNLATVDLQLPGGQLTVQGFLFGAHSRIVHAVTGGTGSYRGARGEFSFTSPSRGILDMTLTLLPEG